MRSSHLPKSFLTLPLGAFYNWAANICHGSAPLRPAIPQSGSAWWYINLI